MSEKLILRLEKFEHTNDTPISSLIVTNEDVELYISGEDSLIWITNKRLITAYKADDDNYFMKANRYETYLYHDIFSIAVDMIDDAQYNVIYIKFKNDFHLQIFINIDLPITEIAQVITLKILN